MVNIGDIVRVEIESLNYSAYAVGRIDGLVAFVSRGVPGDKLIVKITQRKKNYAIAEIVDIVSASPYRCDPPCVHFIEGCGGCQWQHITYECQLYWKKEVIRQALRRIGKLGNIPEIELRRTQNIFHYRNKLSLFHVKGMHTSQAGCLCHQGWQADEEPQAGSHKIPLNPPLQRGIEEVDNFSEKEPSSPIGMYKLASYDIVPIKGCLISMDEINSLINRFQGEAFLSNIGLSEISIRVGAKYGHIMLLCKCRDHLPSESDIDRLLHMPGVTSVFLCVDKGFGKHRATVYGEPTIREEIYGIEYRIGPETFFQVNVTGLKELIDLVKEDVNKVDGIVLDAHCGVGTFALQIAGISSVVWGTDTSSSAIDLAHLNALDNNITNVQFRKGSAEQLLRSELRGVGMELVILNPPRGGCEEADLQAICASRPTRIIYISCNPTTLARDLRKLADAGYELVRLAMVDMFPMTHHLETFALCIRAGNRHRV